MDKKTLLYSAEEIMHVIDEALSIPPDPNAKNIHPTIDDKYPIFHPYEEPMWSAQDTLGIMAKLIPFL